ncbi:hypothetical protein Emag_006742 [Eimeria magna]
MADHGELWAVEPEGGSLSPIEDPEAPLPQPHPRSSPRLSAQIHLTTSSKDFINAESTWRLPSSRPGDKDSWQSQEPASEDQAPASFAVEVPPHFQMQQKQTPLETEAHGSGFWPVRVSAAHPLCAGPQAVEAAHPLPSSPSPSMHEAFPGRPACSHSSTTGRSEEAGGTSSAFAKSSSSPLNHAHLGDPSRTHSEGSPSSQGGQPPPQFFSLDCHSAAADLWSGFCSHSKGSISDKVCSGVPSAHADVLQVASSKLMKDEDDWWWQGTDKDAKTRPDQVQSVVDQWTIQTKRPPARSVGTSESRGAPPREEGLVTQFDCSNRWPSHQVSAPGETYVHLDSVVIHTSGGGGGAACGEEMPVRTPMLALEALPQGASLGGSQSDGVYAEVSSGTKNALACCGQSMSADAASYASSTTSCCSSSPYTSPSSPAASAEGEEPSGLHISTEELEPCLDGSEGASWQQQQQLSCLNPAAPEVGQDEDYGPWCSAAVVAPPSDPAAPTVLDQPSPPRRRSRSSSSSSSSSSGEDSCERVGSWAGSLNQSYPRFTGRAHPLSSSRRRLQNLSSRKGSGCHGQHVQIQFDEDGGVDGGFLSIQRPHGKSGGRTPHTRRSSQLSVGINGRSSISRVNSSMAKMYDRLQQQLEKQEGGVEGRYAAARTPELKLEVEELRKRRLAEPMRQRLLRQYTEHLRRLDSAKAEAVRAEERSDKIRPLLVQVVMAASKLRSLQSSESWREYVGAAVTDVDADLSAFMNNFGEDLSTVEAEEEGLSGAAAGRGICGGFWKRRSIASAFMALMLFYLVVIAGVVIWLQQTGTNNTAPSPASTKHQPLL